MPFGESLKKMFWQKFQSREKMNEPRFSNYFFEKRGSSFIQSVAISEFQEFRSIDRLF